MLRWAQPFPRTGCALRAPRSVARGGVTGTVSPMTIRVRRATAADGDLVTWVMLAASRSHLDRGIWEYLNASDEEATLSFVRRLPTTSAVHMFHSSLFLVAELDGEPGAAMCAYDSASQGFDVALPEMAAATAAEGIDGEDP